MRIKDFLTLVARPGRTNYFVICADELGMGDLLRRRLTRIASPEDLHFYNAAEVTKERARQLEVEARRASRGGSQLNHVYLFSLQKLPRESVGPLLKVVEQAQYTRFIFQAQHVPRKIQTLRSRAAVVRLPFIKKAAVLANLRLRSLDARTADELNLYDGTLEGTARALGTKDTTAEIRRAASQGLRGIPVLFRDEVLNSLAFERALYQDMTPEEIEFLEGKPNTTKRKLVAFRLLARAGE